MHRDALGDGGVLFHRRVVHLAAPERFLPIVPDFIPMPHAVVVMTVLARSLAALAPDQEVAPACWRHASHLPTRFFPANIKHAIEAIHVPPLPTGWWYHGPRLIMQPVLVWWALFCAEVIDWPSLKHRTP
jgi:uncharacterized membrane protein